MMADFVRQHIGLGKLTWSAEALLEFVVEPKVDVNLFIDRTIKRAGGGLSRAAAGVSNVAKQHQLGVAIVDIFLLKNLSPGLLRVIQDERNKLHGRRFAGVTGAVRL